MAEIEIKDWRSGLKNASQTTVEAEEEPTGLMPLEEEPEFLPYTPETVPDPQDIINSAIHHNISLWEAEERNRTEQIRKAIPDKSIYDKEKYPFGVLTAPPEPSTWQKFKNFFVGDRPSLPPDADRMEKVDRAFDMIVGSPLRAFVKFSKGVTLNVPDLMWAGIKRITPDDIWENEIKYMNLDQAMDWAAGYDPSGFEKTIGEVAEFAGRLYTAGQIGESVGLLGNTPRGAGVLIKASETAKLFGLASASEQLVKYLAEQTDPEAYYGGEGKEAVLRDMAIGAILSMAHSGIKGIWNKLKPTEQKAALNILGLKKGATEDEIIKASRRLALETHPDKVRGMEERFIQIMKARDLLLKEPKKGIIYRKMGPQPPKQIAGEIKTIGVEKPVVTEKAIQPAEIAEKIGISKAEAMAEGITKPIAKPEAPEAIEKPEIEIGYEFEYGGAPYKITKILEGNRAVAERTDIEKEPMVFDISGIPELLKAEKAFGVAKAPTAEKQPWEMTKIEVGTQNVTSQIPKYPFKWTNLEGKTEYAKTEEQLNKLREKDFIRHKQFIKQALSEGKPVPRNVLEEYAGEDWADEALAKMEKPPEKPTIERRDILGGVEPVQQITQALKKAKKLRPLTEAEQKAERKRRVGAAAGAMEAGVKKGTPAERAIFESKGLLKGPLAEYSQLYESIRDIVEPGAINEAFLTIHNNPNLRYFEVIDTATAFKKLIDGAALTIREAELIEKQFGLEMAKVAERQVPKSSLFDRIATIWRAGLLTGIKTSGLNTFSNFSHAITETLKDIPAIAVDKTISLFTGKTSIALTGKKVAKGIKEGFIKGYQYMKTGHDERDVGAKLDYRRIKFGESKFAKGLQAYEEFMFHLMGAEDQPFYYGAKARSISSQAIAQAKNAGLKGKEAQSFINNLIENPTDEMLKYALIDAETAVFQNRTMLGDIGKAIQKAPGGMIIVPFSRTPSAVAMQIINYSPAGFLKTMAENVGKGKFDQRLFSQGMGRAVVGTGVMYLGMLLFKAGMMTLDRPKSERERKLWELEGRKENAIKIGGKWRSAIVLGPAGITLLIGGHFSSALEEKGSPTEAIVTALTGTAKSFSEQTFVRGVNQAVAAIADPERSFEVFFSSLAGSSVPTIVGDIARATDTKERISKGPFERIKSRIPGLRGTLEPRIDVFGQDLPRYGGNPLEVMIDPTRPAKIKQDAVIDELRRLWDLDVKVAPTLLGDKYGYDILTPDENTRLWQRVGQLTYHNLYKLINSGTYRRANNEEKGKLINNSVKIAKDTARAEIAKYKLTTGTSYDELVNSKLLTYDVEQMWEKLYGIDLRKRKK